MNSEENKREPEAREEPGPEEDHAETLEEPAGSPGDPASLGQEKGAEEAPVEEPAFSAEEFAALREELETVCRERDGYLDSLRRLKAEFENSRKRQERERARVLETASENLVLALLPVVDNLERALESEGDIREGVRATHEQLMDILSKEGLLPVASDGQHFDPNVHEAVMSQPSDEHEEGTILQTFERGYVLKGKPIRPAKVVVAN